MSSPFPAQVASGLSLASVLPDARRIGAADLRFRSCSGSWTDCQPGDVFVAIESEQGDGHDHAQDAVARGASGVVAERLLAVSAPQFLVDDTRQAFGSLCHALAGQPASRLLTVAVGGTDGKTVTSHLVEAVLAAGGHQTAISSCAVGSETGGRVDDCPSSLSAWLERMVRDRRTAAVIEAGSAGLAQHVLAGAEFDVAVLTNIRGDESDRHGSELNYRRVQERLLGHLKRRGIAVLNADDANSARLLAGLQVPVLTVGMRQEADVTARIVDCDAGGQTFCLSAGDDSALMRTRTIGLQQVYNCLAAAAVGLATGIDLEQIARGISDAPGVRGRLEPVVCGQDFGVWVDSASRPSQVAAALHAVRRLTRGRVLVAVAMRDGQSARERARLGGILERRADVAVITQADCGLIRDYEPAHQILDGMENPGRARLIPGRLEAIEWLLAEARPGDSVLLAGAGNDPIAWFGEEQIPVRDSDVATAWLNDRPALCPAAARRAAVYRMGDNLQ